MRATEGAYLVLVALLSACGPHVPRYPDLANRDLFLCCNLWVSGRNTASDANYSTYWGERGGAMMPAGTQVKVMRDEDSELQLMFAGMTEPFLFRYQYGQKQVPAGEYFRLLLLEQNPRPVLQGLPPDVVAAVNEGRLLPGMTKAQALMARGYPPFHRTPSVEANEWVYYDSPGFVERVQFVDGRITSIQRERAPEK